MTTQETSCSCPPGDERYARVPRTLDDWKRGRSLAKQLDVLSDRAERVARWVELSCERRDPALEWPLEACGSNRPLRVVPVDLLRSPSGERIPVVRGELLVPADQDNDGRRGRLAELGFRPPDDGQRDPHPCPDVVRFTSTTATPEDLQRALDSARADDVPVSPHYVAALRNPVKSHDGPEYTDHPPEPEPGDGDGDDADERGNGACVVIVDTGLDPHAASRTDTWLRDMNGSENDPLDAANEVTKQLTPDGYLDGAAGHGTFVAGIVRQIAPNARVRVVRALDSRGLGTECDIARAIDRARTTLEECGGGVLNLSLGVFTVDSSPPVVIERALRRLPDNVLVVAAAGNSPTADPIWPASFDGVVGVGALMWEQTEEGAVLKPAPWSNRGTHVDFSAVGDNVCSTYVRGREHPARDADPERFPRNGQAESYARWSGTSFSTPKVSALLAKLLTRYDPETAVGKLSEGRDAPWEGYGRVICF